MHKDTRIHGADQLAADARLNRSQHFGVFGQIETIGCSTGFRYHPGLVPLSLRIGA